MMTYDLLDHNIQTDPNENYEFVLKILTEAKIERIPKKIDDSTNV